MIQKIFKIMIIAVILSLGSCATNGDLDDLQNQLEDLEGQVGDLEGDLSKLEAEQQAALAAQIATLLAQITDLQEDTQNLSSDYAGLSSDYDALLESLSNTQDEIAAGAKVHYGSVITDEDYASLVSSEATIVTGSVVVSSDANIASLANVALIGGDLVVNGASAVNIPMLETVSGNVTIEGVSSTDAMVSLPLLKSVGLDFTVSNNTGLVSVETPELLLINGNLSTANKHSALRRPRKLSPGLCLRASEGSE